MKHLLASAAVALALAAPTTGHADNGSFGVFARSGNTAEGVCLVQDANRDIQATWVKGVTADPDPIKTCHVPPERFAMAMDLLVDCYQDPQGGLRPAKTWVEAHCHAEPALPNQKYVCTYAGITREYR